MEFFGITSIGYGNYISEVVREDYAEPKHIPNVKEIIEAKLKINPRSSFSEAYNKLDPILGTGNGFSYGSYERYRFQIKKGLIKPVGPSDIYRIPATTGQDWGFWQTDKLLKDKNWTKSYSDYRMKSSELAKYAPLL